MNRPRRSQPARGLPFSVPILPSARGLAWHVLSQSDVGGFVTDRLDSLLDLQAVPPADRGLATELVYGVTRRRKTLDRLIEATANRAPHTIEPPLRALLQLGAYQRLFLDRIPPHAAVSETVQLTKQVQRPRWTPFCNGVLRGIDRLVSDRFVDAPAVDACPIRPGAYRQLNEAVFSDPQIDWPGWFAEAFSFPLPLSHHWHRTYSAEEMLGLGFWFNERPAIWLRVNSLRADRAAVLDALQTAGHPAFAPEDAPLAIRLESSVPVATLPGYLQGEFSVQDLSAQRSIELLDPQPSERIWDVCAAPGGKTCAIAEWMRDTGRVLASDPDEGRLPQIEQNAHRLGLRSITVASGDALESPPHDEFDAALVDVPCSNTGVLGRRPEARWRINLERLPELTRLQTRLLLTAVDAVRPGGRIVYSTCSIESSENRTVVEAVLGSRPGLSLEKELASFPGRPADGGYAALLMKRPTAGGR